ncbi:multiheme c-type cytochrome [uncultured Paludibaculum sp.]|uniref:multiheme c-type cytochrome n=1 Tax=uncultured Paludibaculum sp. TaxID=1765020 RepID=UPI002AAB59C2|nr:multiheme c-type cytochrome [uncultured Paludibaculum sp.]
MLILAGQCATAQQSKTCAPCHPKEAQGHSHTLMARTLEPGGQAALLAAHPDLRLKLGSFDYRIYRAGAQSRYVVSDGVSSMEGVIAWAMGQGAAGQTYVLERGGKLYESRVSFYNDIKGLDATLGSPPGPPKNLEEAFGREMPALSVTECFQCHAADGPSTGAAPPKGTLAWTKALVPGVQCENCHKGAWKHAAARGAGDAKSARLPKLRESSTEELSDVCGACHRTWSHVQLNGPRGVANVRFQPYRIVLSKCYDALDRRIGCTACHDPHNRPEAAVVNYDAACRNCHGGQTSDGKPVAVCKVGTKQCASCHMPKYELPGSHFRFADHFIRIARPNETYPD